MVDVENDVAFAHVEIPGNNRGGVDDLDHNLMEVEEIKQVYIK